MTTIPPAAIGMSLAEIETPALVIDLDAFEHNLRHMAALVAAHDGVGLRPHAKTHKSPAVAQRQIALGAAGQCCQKVGEAEALVAGGILDVLVSNQIVGRRKLDRLAGLARQARISVCVDDAGNVAELSAAAARFEAVLEVLVEIDVGAGRCGVRPGPEALELARAIIAAPNLTFGGLQAYHGAAQHIRGHNERGQAIAKAGALTGETVALLRGEGIECRLVTGAGTGTFPFEAASGVWNELQAGSYCFMDADYARNLDEGGAPISSFRHSLFVHATIISRRHADRAVCDAGLKALAMDSGPPDVAGLADVTYLRASDEHGLLQTGAAAPALAPGDRIRLIPGHCDPTVNLYDWYVGARGDRVESLWPIAARGAVI